MKKKIIIATLFMSILLICSIVQAQELNQTELEEQTQLQEQIQSEEQTQDPEQSQTYSGINRLTDNVKLAFSGGDNKVRQALEIKEKEVNSAINNVQNNNEDKAIKNLEREKKKLEIVQERVSLETSEEIKTSAEEVTRKINNEEVLTGVFDEYLLEEEKTILVAALTEKTFEYCTELAKEDFGLMLEQEICDPETAVPGLEEKLKELKDLQYKMFVQLMLEIRSCIDDPGTCNCEVNVEDSEKAKCEKMVALALKCEYNEDETSCAELEAMKPSPGDGFARSFVPDWLMDLFGEKYKMIEYGIQHSDGVPEECWDWNEKPECRQYDYLKETKEDWDEYGNYRPILYPGKHPSTGGTPESPPTIQEAFPECYNEEGMFLSECGNINIVLAEDGSVNYIVDKQIDDIIKDFENKSEQHLMEIRKGWMMVEGKWVIDPGQINNEDGTINDDEGNWTIDEGEWTVSNKAREIKRDMNQITKQIKDITYAPGTGPGDNGGDVDGDDVAPGPQGIVGVVDNNVVSDNGNRQDVDSGNNVVDNTVVGNGGTVDSGTMDNGDSDSDSGGNDIDNTVDPGPDGIVGVIEGSGEPGLGDEGLIFID